MKSKFLKKITKIKFQNDLTIQKLNDLILNIAFTSYNEEYTLTGEIDIWLLEDNTHIRVEDFETEENILIWIDSNNKIRHDYQKLNI